MEPRLKNWKQNPPPGGWGITYTIRGQNFGVMGTNPDMVVKKIIEIQKRNNDFHGHQRVWDYCNRIWCARAPQRCGAVHRELEKSVYVPADNTVTTPAQYGPKLWGMLDTFGMKGAFSVPGWLAAMNHISQIFNPTHSPDIGCSTCHNEWINILRDHPPMNVTNSKEAAKWVFEVHNRVNRNAGKPQFKWETAVIRNHWET